MDKQNKQSNQNNTSMDKQDYTVNGAQLNELEGRIIDKETELLNEIQVALNNNNLSSYNHLKTLQLQCRAQLRLINYIKSGMQDDNYIIC